MQQHIKILSVLFILAGIVGLVIAVGFLVLGAGAVSAILAEDNSPDAQVGAAWTGGCLTFIAVLVGLLSIPNIIAGWGLSQRKSWARVLTIVLSILALPQFPVGTALGVYALVIMFNDETKRLFAS